jgi:hypothetical protein
MDGALVGAGAAGAAATAFVDAAAAFVVCARNEAVLNAAAINASVSKYFFMFVLNEVFVVG